MNWDVAIDSVNRRLGVGIIMRDHQGMVIAARSQTVSIIAELVVAEALAALNAVEFSRNLGLSSILLKGDSLQVVTAVKDTSPNWSRYGHIISDIKIVLQGLRD